LYTGTRRRYVSRASAGRRISRGSVPVFEQRESELYFGLQGLAIHAHGRAAREQNLGLRRQRAEQVGGEARLGRGPRPTPSEGREESVGDVSPAVQARTASPRPASRADPSR
jgi:hypothetical protein